MKKEKVENKISDEMLKAGKKIYVVVLITVIALFGIAAYAIFGNKEVGGSPIAGVIQSDNLLELAEKGILTESGENWSVGDRDLLLFATLAYEPAEGWYYLDNGKEGAEKDWTDKKQYINYVCPDAIDNNSGKCMIDEERMVGMKAADNQFLGNQTFYRWQTVGKEYYFAGLDSNGKTEYYGSIDEVKDWAIVDYTSNPTVKLFKTGGNFEATTFRFKNNIVIAYRGTDFSDLLEWLADFVGYGVAGNLGNYEKEAKAYAKRIIEKYTKEYEGTGIEPNFYITGHSLGGYLAQIGGAYVADPANKVDGREYLRDVIYFNGMGIGFNDGLKFNFSDSIILGRWTEEVAAENKTYQTLLKWSNGTLIAGDTTHHKVICYNNYGDLISSLGIHVEQKGFYAASGAIRRHMQDNAMSQLLLRNKVGQKVFSTIFTAGNRLFKVSRLNEVRKYYDYYNTIYGTEKTISFPDLLWFAHEPSASLLYNISQGDRGAEKEIEVETTHSYSDKTKRVTYTFYATANGTPTSYQWYKNGKKINGAQDYMYTDNVYVGSKVTANKYTVQMGILQEDGTEKNITGTANVDTIIPRVTISNSEGWKVRRKGTITLTVKAIDDSKFADTTISTSDISLTGIAKNLIVSSVSPAKPSNSGKTQTWTITLKGNIVGFAGVKIKAGAIRDSYGNPNTQLTSKTIKVTL